MSETQAEIHLGDTAIRVITRREGTAPLVLLNLHEDERTSIEAANAVIAQSGGMLVWLRHDGGRLIRFKVGARGYTVDPNRLFTDAGAAESVSPRGAGHATAVAAARRFAARLLEHLALPPAGPLVALHNNSHGPPLTVHSFARGGKFEGDAAGPAHVEPDEPADDFFLVTTRNLFDRLAARRFNVVLQNNASARDDGSLSVYCGRQGIPYVNVEALHGALERQTRMIRAVVDVLAPAGPRHRLVESAGAASDASAPEPRTTVKGSEFIRSLPEKPGAERERRILEAVRAGLALPVRWVPVQTSWRDHVGTIFVAEDALAIGEPDDWVRVTVSHTTAQHIADVLDARLPTSHISDLAYAQAAVVLPPCIQAWDPRSMNTSRMLRHHHEVESHRAGRAGLVRTVGKDWVLTNKLAGRPDRAANYGWHSPRAPYRVRSGLSVWQGVGTRHCRTHTDYSQVLCLVRKTMTVDGVERALDDVLRSPDLYGLVSREGPLLFTRHPGVAPLASGDAPPEAAFEASDGPATADAPGARALRLAQSELAAGVREEPLGSNSGRRVREYLHPCVRDRRLPDGSVERFRLGLTHAEWCAAFACWCAVSANADGDVPHFYRASVAELWRDAVASGAARPPSYRPRIGDLGIYARSGGDPTKGGRGHVARVCAEPDEADVYETIDGNHNHRVEQVRRVLGDCVGWIAYGDPAEAPAAADLSAAEWLVRLAAEVEASTGGPHLPPPPTEPPVAAMEAVGSATLRAASRAVVIDPGHGGSGPTLGGSSPNNATGPRGTREKDLTLDLALRATRMFVEKGVSVALTRDSDRNLSLTDRASVAREARARVFVSIHFNGDASPEVQGTETWVHTAAGDNSQLLARSVQLRLVATTGYRDRGVRAQDLGVLDPARHDAGTAACLAEVSFLTDPRDEGRLSDSGYRDALAAALVRGVTDYLAGGARAPLALPDDPA